MLCSIALPSTLCAALHGQYNVDSMFDCKPGAEVLTCQI